MSTNRIPFFLFIILGAVRDLSSAVREERNLEEEIEQRTALEMKIQELEDEIEHLQSSKEGLRDRLEESENVRESWERQIEELEGGLKEQDLQTRSWYHLAEERGLESIKLSREIAELKMQLYASETSSKGEVLAGPSTNNDNNNSSNNNRGGGAGRVRNWGYKRGQKRGVNWGYKRGRNRSNLVHKFLLKFF
jgi:TolA-binding protein